MKRKQHKKNLTAIHLPDWSEGNPYQSLLANSIRKRGWKVRFENYPDGLMPLKKIISKAQGTDTIHLHWIAPYIQHTLWSKSSFYFLTKTALLALDILYCRAKGKRVIWTIHNRISHESENPVREKKIRVMLAICASHLIFHSTGARESFIKEITKVPYSKTSIIPHGNYIDIYKTSQPITDKIAEKLEIRKDHRVILFFGAVRHYKGIPKLISAFSKTDNPDLRLIIAGRPFEPALQTEIIRAAEKDSRIKPYLKFIPDNEVAPLHALADIVAIPFENTLTSGSVILAMSLERALILPEKARVLDIVEEAGSFFYKDEEELTAYLKMDTTEDLKTMGKNNLLRVQDANWEEIAKKTERLYL